MVISGAPGSGKTLVLAARARWMARNHPEWRVQVLCYNRLLVPYLRSLVAEFPNVDVNTFGKFSFSHGLRMSLRSEGEAAAALPVAVAKASPVVDALLIDEWQDFFPSWLRLLQEMLFPGRGGMTLAGDPEQALYRDGGVLPDALGVRHVELGRSYRSTRQIMEVAGALDGDVGPTASCDAPEGEPADLVWAANPREQADSIARDIGMMVDAGTRPLSQIAILYTRKWQVGALVGALRAAGIPFHVANPKEADAFKLTNEQVKLITVHSSKGYEFDVVFLAGLELLPDPDGSEENERVGRIGYVGASRARDQLVITYSRENEYLMRIRQLPEATLRRWVWPDDYPEV
jgi:superfamily I DNA/RNA helicase